MLVYMCANKCMHGNVCACVCKYACMLMHTHLHLCMHV